MASFADITDRKQMEKALKESSEKLSCPALWEK
jgi:hypothetical protein